MEIVISPVAKVLESGWSESKARAYNSSLRYLQCSVEFMHQLMINRPTTLSAMQVDKRIKERKRI
jgi:hypothetical protein